MGQRVQREYQHKSFEPWQPQWLPLTIFFFGLWVPLSSSQPQGTLIYGMAGLPRNRNPFTMQSMTDDLGQSVTTSKVSSGSKGSAGAEKCSCTRLPTYRGLGLLQYSLVSE